MKMGPVLAVREGSPADQHVNPPNAADKLEGDLIESVKVTDADGKTLEFKGDTLDPERLPLQLRQWSDRMDQAKRTEPRIVTLQVRRHRAQAGAQFESKEIKLAWDKSWRFDRAAPVSATAPMPIPELGLAYQITTTVAGVTRDDSPLEVGDVVKDIQYEFENFKDDGKSPWTDDSFAPGQWANIAFELFQRPYHFKKLEFKIQRGKEELVVEIPLHTDPSAPLTDRGWGLATDMRRVKADGMAQAISMGFKDTGNFMLNVFQSLRGIATRRISVKQIGGPFMIAEAAYRYAGRDFGDFVFFLGLISINLAVVNFLPVPVLDGGHMVFLIYESIRRKPAPEAVRNAATWVGLAMIASLMLFVLCLDTLRIFFTRS
jgi:regulator of sigma E protease